MIATFWQWRLGLGCCLLTNNHLHNHPHHHQYHHHHHHCHHHCHHHHHRHSIMIMRIIDLVLVLLAGQWQIIIIIISLALDTLFFLPIWLIFEVRIKPSRDYTFTAGPDLTCSSSRGLNSDDFPFFWILYCSSGSWVTAFWRLVNICWVWLPAPVSLKCQQILTNL